MRQVSRIASYLVVILLLLAPTSAAAAGTTKNKGLFISPLRAYTQIDAGQTKQASVTIGNLTDKTIDVTLSVEQFSVTNYTYDYQFSAAQKDWVRLTKTQVQLQPYKSQVIPYQITVPPHSAPGGQYFTIVATTSFGDVTSKVQAASPLYLTVNGQLTKSASLQGSSIRHLSLGGAISFTLDVKDTGNTHFFVYTIGALHGLNTTNMAGSPAHILLPGTTRTVGGDIPAPTLPGVYKATYGYRTDTGQTFQRSSYVVYAPPWAFALPLGLVLLATGLWRYCRRKHPRKVKVKGKDS